MRLSSKHRRTFRVQRGCALRAMTESLTDDDEALLESTKKSHMSEMTRREARLFRQSATALSRTAVEL